MVKATIKWLDKSGYIWLNELQLSQGVHKATLTPASLKIVKQVPNSIDPALKVLDLDNSPRKQSNFQN